MRIRNIKTNIFHSLLIFTVISFTGCEGNGFRIDTETKTIDWVMASFTIKGDSCNIYFDAKMFSQYKYWFIDKTYLLKPNPEYNVYIDDGYAIDGAHYVFKPKPNVVYTIMNRSNGDAGSCYQKIIFDSLFNMKIVPWSKNDPEY